MQSCGCWLILGTVAIIAIIYLPISIASSIFGMNVQELNGQGVGIIWFVVTIFTAFGVLLLSWLFFAIMTSQRNAVKDRWNERLRDELWSREPRTWAPRFWFIGMTRQRVTFWPHRIYEALTALKNRTLVSIGLMP